MNVDGWLTVAGVLSAAFAASVGPPAPDVADTPDNTISVAAAVEPTQAISVRFISIAGDSCSAMSTTAAREAVDLLNKAGGTSGLKFRFYRHDVIPLRKDVREAAMTIDDMVSLATPMGISVAKMNELQDHMARTYPVPADRKLSRWLDSYRQKMMPDQVVVWQGCKGGVEMHTGAFVFGKANAVHELGHGFNLSHTFTTAKRCGAWDLIYAARGRGKSNVYFTSKHDCETFEADSSGYTFYRIDPREGEPEGAKRRFPGGGVVTLQHPRCATCGEGVRLGDPLTDGVERHATGAPEIAGYARFIDGVGAINALTYCATRGCPKGNAFYSASQIDRMKAWAAQESWVFAQGNPLSVARPSDTCGHLRANEGLRRDEALYSCDGRFRLYVQPDANVVLTRKPSEGQGTTAIWSTRPLVAGTDTTDLVLLMRGDGNLVVADNHPKVLWQTGTQGNPGLYLKLTDDGDLQVRSPSEIYWRTNTGGN